jgi:O-antigen ligase
VGPGSGVYGEMSDGVARARAGLTCVAAGALVLAVAVAVDPWGLRPFTTGRWALVSVAAAVAAASVRWRPPRWLALTGAVFLALVALATVTALDPLTAVVGHPRRHLGLAGWVVCGLACLAGTGLPAAGVRRGLGRAGVVAAGVTGAAVLADLAGWDPVGGRFAGGRVGGLLGQPVYLGALAVLLAPVAAGVAADGTAPRAWRRAGLAAAAGCGLAAVASGTRGAWLGALVAAVVAWPRIRSVLAAIPDAMGAVRRRNGGRAVRVALAGAAVVGGLALAVPVGARALDALDPGAAGGRGRLDEWVVAARVVADRPLTGAGPEGYRIAAPARVDDGYARRHGRDEVIDRAHDGPLDVAVSAGLPAAAAYVVLLGGVVVAAVRVARRSPDPVLAGAALGVVAWVGQQAVGFPVAEVDPAAWLLAGAVATAAPGLASVTARARGEGRQVGARVLAGTLAVVLAAGGVTAVAADRDLRAAERADAAGDVADAAAAADRATARRPDDVDAWYVAARVASAGPGLLAVDAGLDRVEDGLGRLPLDPALRALHADLLVERALRSGLPADLAAAERAARERTRDDPAGPAGHRQLGMVLAARGDGAAAAASLARALDLDPGDTVAETALAALDDPDPGEDP